MLVGLVGTQAKHLSRDRCIVDLIADDGIFPEVAKKLLLTIGQENLRVEVSARGVTLLGGFSESVVLSVYECL
jgi:hypothetical protein